MSISEKQALLGRWLDATVFELGRHFRWSYLPPLMVYFAAGVSGLTSIVATFYVKESLGLSAEFLASLAFWAGIPWALKMPLGHVVDLVWRWKALLVYGGAALLAASIAIMYGLVSRPEILVPLMPAGSWYVLSALLAPVGYVVQDTVADAMTVEAVPLLDVSGKRHTDAELKQMHITMQTLGRVAIIGGSLAVALLNVTLFQGVEAMSSAETRNVYASVYAIALAIPALSVAGVILGSISVRRQERLLRHQGLSEHAVAAVLPGGENTVPNWWILAGGLGFVVFTLAVGLVDVPFAQEIIFLGSLTIVGFLMQRLLRELPPESRGPLLGTALIIFVFRAVPLPGAGVTWWEIDVLGFDQQFISVLTVMTSGLTLLGMFLLRKPMATLPIARIIALLTIAAGLLSLPNIGLYYGLHEWTMRYTGGIVDARFIAILDTAIESPLGQVAMVPMLAWIAKHAPAHLKATFFAVMASFTNLALSASSLGTKYLNQTFVVTREVADPRARTVTVPADYNELGWLLITVSIIVVAVPLLTILAVQRSPLRTAE